jgi:hypothetical protein
MKQEKNSEVRKSQIPFRRRGIRYTTDRFKQTQKLNGVCYYLHDKGIVDGKAQHDTIRNYVSFKCWKIEGDRYIIKACILIQQDFVSFTLWLHNYHLKTV